MNATSPLTKRDRDDWEFRREDVLVFKIFYRWRRFFMREYWYARHDCFQYWLRS